MRWGRWWFGVNAVVVVVALVIQIPITAGATGGFFDTPAARVANLFTFFTILSNLIVGATSVLLAIDPHRTSRVFATLRLDAVLAIAITAIVYHLLLAGLDDFHGAEAFANQLWHTVSPLLAVVGWVVFGPRGLVNRRVVAWSLVYPMAWLVGTLVRGALIGWYPYPFVDVIKLGYGRVALNCVGITALFFVLAALTLGIDATLDRRDDARTGGARIQP